VASVYLMAKSCLHTVINYLIIYSRKHPTKICHICFLITSQYRILRKHRYSAEMSTFRGSAQNFVFCGKLVPNYICITVCGSLVQCIGKIGTVHRITDRGDIRVQYDGANNRWTFHALSLTKVRHSAVCFV